jgi:hypothetical protein
VSNIVKEFLNLFKIDTTAVFKTGERIVELMRERTEKGLDINKKPFKSYADTSAIPAAAIPSKFRQTFKQKGVLSFFVFNKKTWVRIEGGYRAYKQIVFKDNYDGGKVNLKAKGEMLNSLKVLSTANGKIKIGFADTKNEKIAGYVQAKRKFLGITQAEIESDVIIKKIIETGLKINSK